MTKKYFGDVKEIKGEVHITRDHCKGCAFCVEYCPRDVLAMSEAFNTKGYHPPFVLKDKKDECCYCKLCEAICPEFAIFVAEKKEE
jgi:2-oxoglutarate ferredoxin oxidoreductase subunit delta